MRRKTSQDYYNLAAERGFEWLGREVVNSRTKTEWRCVVGHEWRAEYSRIRYGDGCPHCGGHGRKTAKDYHSVGVGRGIEWIGTTPPSKVRIKTEWRCLQGHEWTAPYDAILQGNGCPHCSNHIPKTAVDYHALADKRNLEWLGPEAPNTRSRDTYWRGSCGHEWATSYHGILSGYGCPICSGSLPRTAGDYATLARERSFIWLGPMVKNTKTNTSWQCAKGHVWESPYNSIRDGHGCHQCVNVLNGNYTSTQQVAIHAMIGGEMNRRIWRYSIDIALEVSGVNIAIEYDSAYWHEGREDEDKRRDDYLIAHGYRVLHIRSGHLLPTRAQLNAAIQELLNGATYAEIILDDWSRSYAVEGR